MNILILITFLKKEKNVLFTCSLARKTYEINKSTHGVSLLSMSMKRLSAPYVSLILLTILTPILALWTLFMCLYFVLYRNGFVCITLCISQWLGYLLHFSACFVCPLTPFLLGDLVSHAPPLSIAVCHVFPDLPSLISIYRDVLAHDRHPSSQLGFHIFQGCQ